MYKTILLTLDGTPTDRAIIDHIKQLATLVHSRVVLLHVADGGPLAPTARMRSAQRSRKTRRI